MKGKSQVSLIQKTIFITKGFRQDVFFILLLLLIGMVFEMASIGIIIPAIGFLLSSNIQSEFPSMISFFNSIGLEKQKEIVLFSLVIIVFVFLTKTIFMVYLSWKQSNFSAQLSSRTSNKLYSVYLKQPYTFHLFRNSTELMKNIITEVHEFSEMLKAIFVLTIELTALLGITLILLIQEPFGTFLIFFVIVVSSIFMQRITKKKLSSDICHQTNNTFKQ
jgi:ABC-type multidrug transport system fused ATPase/permease subunit